MSKVSFTDRLRYAFDNTMSRGATALIGWLALLSLVIVVVMGLIVSLFNLGPAGNEKVSFSEAVWLSLMRTFDAGTMGGDEGWPFRLAMLVVTIGGIFVISTLIGVLTSGLETQIEELRKGRSKVIESNHTVILGWSPQVFPIISELVIANANQPKSCVAVLGDKDKVEMEDKIREMVTDTGRTRIVCRTGSPIEMADLDIISLQTAKSIIILAPEDDDPDAQVIKTILAITNNPQRHPEPYHIVAELHTPKNLEVARMVGQDEVELVLVGELIARITAQTCRQSGLSVVYTELLDFGGDEIYFQEEPALVGKSFGEALLAYEDSAVIGLHPHRGTPVLNPPMDTLIRTGDRIIAVSEDDDTVRVSGRTNLDIATAAIRTAQPTPAAPEQILLLGWNWRATTIINELDNYVAPGSTLIVLAESADGEAEIARRCRSLNHLTVTFKHGDITDRATLDELPFADSDHVILVSCSDVLTVQQADARTLITLLHLRDIVEKNHYHFSIVSEMLDIRNRKLAEVTRADDFVVSERLVSLLLTQISENKALGAVFTDLFDPEGSEVYLKPATDYVAPDQPINFYTVVEAARQRGEVAFGYRLQRHAGDAAQQYGVVVNPNKSQPVTFSADDRIIVLSES